MWFLFDGSLNLVNLELSGTKALLLGGGLCLLFFLQHSLMVRSGFRRWSTRFIPAKFNSALYTIASGISLLLLIMLWQDSDQIVVAFVGIVSWLFCRIFFLSIAGMIGGIRSLDGFDPVGIQALKKNHQQPDQVATHFVVRGPYRWIRHPLYFFNLLLIWSCPDITADRLLFNFLFTAWIIIGAKLEERDLVNDFGEVYRDYQQNVPMLIPNRLHPYEVNQTSHKVTVHTNSR
jgi:protein-S-isoprenylcysteine O-methyltransferase Ste14